MNLQFGHCIHKSNIPNATRKSSNQRNAPSADWNGKRDPILIRTSPRFWEGISNFIHASESLQLLKKTDKTSDRYVASRKQVPQKKFSSLDAGLIVAEIISVIAVERKVQKFLLYSLSLFANYDNFKVQFKEAEQRLVELKKNMTCRKRRKSNKWVQDSQEYHLYMMSVLSAPLHKMWSSFWTIRKPSRP